MAQNFSFPTIVTVQPTPNLQEGPYTETITGHSDCTAGGNGTNLQWQRQGDSILVNGYHEVISDGVGGYSVLSFRVPLPVATTISATKELTGTACGLIGLGAIPLPGYVRGVIATDDAQVNVYPPTGTIGATLVISVYFTFAYQVI